MAHGSGAEIDGRRARPLGQLCLCVESGRAPRDHKHGAAGLTQSRRLSETEPDPSEQCHAELLALH